MREVMFSLRKKRGKDARKGNRLPFLFLSLNIIS